ncbi:MAG: 16S rRNA (guanine(527)-N(7))-methyltransferase RsmG [Acidobacteriota bacterium]|nr:16S rRNA (guanine(527)-N(7))-methyltransferase RsmG [Acidobacteriota bacterium]
MTDRRREFLEALEALEGEFGASLDDEKRARLADYFESVERWNARLHLVAPCPPREFAARHVLESLVALEHLPRGARVIDVGSGAGLPIIPCLVARDDLRAALYEANAKKSVFLREAISALGLRDAARVVNSRFEDAEAPDAEAVTCRALERFAEALPRLVSWSPARATLLLFGGESLRESIESAGLSCEAVRIPLSERRFLFVARHNDSAVVVGSAGEVSGG